MSRQTAKSSWLAIPFLSEPLEETPAIDLERGGPKDLSVVKPWGELAKSVIKQGGFTNVSVEAMRYRLQNLNLVRDRETATAQRPLL